MGFGVEGIHGMLDHSRTIRPMGVFKMELVFVMARTKGEMYETNITPYRDLFCSFFNKTEQMNASIATRFELANAEIQNINYTNYTTFKIPLGDIESALNAGCDAMWLCVVFNGADANLLAFIESEDIVRVDSFNTVEELRDIMTAHFGGRYHRPTGSIYSIKPTLVLDRVLRLLD